MFSHWNHLSEERRLLISLAAMGKAIESIARQAEVLAQEIENGGLSDCGGPEALRLLAAVMRVTAQDQSPLTGPPPGDRVLIH